MLIDEDQIDGELHEEGVNRKARNDPQTFAGIEALMLQEADVAFVTGIGHGNGVTQHCAASFVANVYDQSS